MTRTVRLNFYFALVIFAQVANLAAQEELPAPASAKPAPAPAPARRPLLDPLRAQNDPQRANLRAERRERLRNLGGQVLDVLAQPEGTTPIDLPKLNAALGPVVTALLGGGNDIESLHIGFDPGGTDFAADRYLLKADAVLRRSAWSAGPSQIRGTIGAQVKRSEAGMPIALLDADILLHTSTVDLANYLVTQYKQREASQEAEPGPPNDNALFTQMLDERLARVDRLESLDDVADLLTAISGLRLTAISQRIEGLRADARAATDAETKQALEAKLAEVRAERDRMFDIRPRIARNSNGTVRSIAVEMLGPELFPGADLQSMDVQLQEDQVAIKAAGILSRWVELYPVAKPLIVGVLTRIQNGDPRALDGIRPLLDGPLRRGRAVIIGEP